MALLPLISLGHTADTIKTAVSVQEETAENNVFSIPEESIPESSNTVYNEFKILDTSSGNIISVDDRTFCCGALAYEMLPNSEKEALKAQLARKEQELSQTTAVSVDDLLSKMDANEKRELSVVVKSDTQGSLEAIVESLNNIKSEKVSLKVIATGTGNVSLTDVKTASAGKATIVGFDIGCDSGVQQQARHDGVRINSFRIIYELIDHVKQCMLDLLPPEYTEKVLGHATIKAVYDIGKVGKIAGSQMLDGKLVSTARYRILRGKEKVWEGKLQTLRHFKDEVKEVTGQQECGVCFAGFEAFAVGDTIECFAMEELPRSL